MNKRGIALVFALLVVVVLSILTISFFAGSINEHNLVKRFVNSTRAFWLAEAGIAEGKQDLPGSSSGINYPFAYVETNDLYSTDLQYKYYQIDSTGTSESIPRRLSAIVRTKRSNADKFPYAIQTTVKLVMKGNVDIDPPNEDTNGIPEPGEGWRQNSVLNFADLFTCSKEDLKSYATHIYTSIDASTPMSGLTWVEPQSGSLNIAGNYTGSGIMIIRGNVHISGTIDFSGIIYVIGDLTITGTVATSGSVLAETDVLLDPDTQLKGTVDLTYDRAAIENALPNIPPAASSALVSWHEL